MSPRSQVLNSSYIPSGKSAFFAIIESDHWYLGSLNGFSHNSAQHIRPQTATDTFFSECILVRIAECVHQHRRGVRRNHLGNWVGQVPNTASFLYLSTIVDFHQLQPQLFLFFHYSPCFRLASINGPKRHQALLAYWMFQYRSVNP